MTQTDLEGFRKILGAKQAEVTKTRGLDGIAIERSADVLEEADYKTARELAIAGLNHESTVRRNVASALLRIQDGSLWRWALGSTGSAKSNSGSRTRNWLRRRDILSTSG
jgi:hypothetical protein